MVYLSGFKIIIKTTIPKDNNIIKRKLNNKIIFSHKGTNKLKVSEVACGKADSRVSREPQV